MKKFVSYLLGGIILIIGVMLLLNFFAKQKVMEQLDDNSIAYDGLSLNLFTNFLKLEKPKKEGRGGVFSAETIKVDDFGYWDYFSSGTISFDDIEIDGPVVLLNDKQKDSTKSDIKFKEEIIIKNLIIRNGHVEKKNQEAERPQLVFKFTEFGMKGIEIDSATVQNKVPFNFKEYFMLEGQLKSQLDEEHDFLISKISMRDGRVLLEDLNIQPLYSTADFYKKVGTAKSRYELRVGELTLDSLHFGAENDSLLLTNSLMTVTDIDLDVYKDKTLPEKSKVKTLYSEKLRQLPFKIKFDSVHMSKGRIVYHERTQTSKPAGTIKFSGVKVNISNLSNIKSSDRVVVSANALFLGESNFQFHHSFNTWNMNNEFTATGKLSTLGAARANDFLDPTENIKLEGVIDYLAFNLSGNEYVANGDMSFRYHDFALKLQKKEGEGEKKLLSALANIFIKKKSKNDEVEQKGINVERDRQRSFWNFIWNFVFEGIKKAVI